ncbi:MAG: aldo/keto reductase [Synergistaceae bacterium]|nr:aldo/keto reductase [Synergistaceae bacterium]
MQYIRLGSSGLKITQLTLGTALTIGTEIINVSSAGKIINTAWEMGIRSFDTSNNYGMGGAEKMLGRIMKQFNRQEFVLSTKGSWPVGDSPYERGLSRKHIVRAVDDSLKRLDTDYIDLYYAHRYDSETSIEEICRTFNMLIQSGKILYWATSEWPAEALSQCHDICSKLLLEKPIAEQFIYSYAVIKAERNGVIDFCRSHDVGTLGFSPLCQGFLTGKYKSGIPEGSRISKSRAINYDKTANFYAQNKSRIDYFIDTCDKYNADYTAAALQYCINKNIYPVFGASSPEQVIMNVKASEETLPGKLWKDLDSYETGSI